MLYDADFRTKEKRTYAAAFDVVANWIRNENLGGFKSPCAGHEKRIEANWKSTM